MAPSHVQEMVITITAEQMGVDRRKISLATHFVSDLNADSLDTVELVMEFEDEFEIEIPDDDAERCQTVADAVRYITKAVGSAKPDGPSRDRAPTAEDEARPTSQQATERLSIEDCFRGPAMADQQDAKGRLRVPREPGIYAWYFDAVPRSIRTEGCLCVGSWTLLYVGKTGDLKRRILTDHFSGNAEGSSLRRRLGCLLGSDLGLQLCRTRSGGWTFGREGERELSKWMVEHARVAWVHVRDKTIAWAWRQEDTEGHVIGRAESELIRETFVLPLNYEENTDYPFYRELKEITDACQQQAPYLEES